MMVVTSWPSASAPHVGSRDAYTISLLAALPLQAISVLLTPISRLLV